jgi:hypothetical protein
MLKWLLAKRLVSAGAHTFSGENFFLSFSKSGSGKNQSSSPQVPHTRKWNFGGMANRVMATVRAASPT